MPLAIEFILYFLTALQAFKIQEYFLGQINVSPNPYSVWIKTALESFLHQSGLEA